ncbi:MAG: hypothetical protein HQL76_15345, partial [Magnetococcales bacterium]|nr:hypothetical protein [Magnetococcales bacterium]
MKQRQLISFDWALKRLLRSKANFEILEGFLTELLREDVRIVEILDGNTFGTRADHATDTDRPFTDRRKR